MACSPTSENPDTRLSVMLHTTSDFLRKLCADQSDYKTVGLSITRYWAAYGSTDCLLGKQDGSLLAYVDYGTQVSYQDGMNVTISGAGLARAMYGSAAWHMTHLIMDSQDSQVVNYSTSDQPCRVRYLQRCDALRREAGSEGLELDFAATEHIFSYIESTCRTRRQSNAPFRLAFWEVTGADPKDQTEKRNHHVNAVHIFCDPSEFASTLRVEA